ncbi:MAG: dihydropteroate synthase [Lentisphaeria bacterium]|nr:dihydropteroate synthase [Lentisphaeria bacterium]
MEFHYKNRSLKCTGQTSVMAIMNVTPDSFSENGANYFINSALLEAKKMIAAGVVIIDVGGESTRPGAMEVSIAEEIARVVPFITGLRKFSDIPVSIDTWKSEVAEAAIIAGADIINDVTGFRRDPKLKTVAAKYKVGCIAMHMRGTPQTMQNPENLQYKCMIKEICSYFKETVSLLGAVGIPRENIMLDPGVGFSKTVEQNIELIRNISQFRSLGYPILLGSSRKSFIGEVLQIKDAPSRTWGTAATVTAGIMNGADMVRVHDFEEMIQVVKMSDLFRKGV